MNFGILVLPGTSGTNVPLHPRRASRYPGQLPSETFPVINFTRSLQLMAVEQSCDPQNRDGLYHQADVFNTICQFVKGPGYFEDERAGQLAALYVFDVMERNHIVDPQLEARIVKLLAPLAQLDFSADNALTIAYFLTAFRPPRQPQDVASAGWPHMFRMFPTVPHSQLRWTETMLVAMSDLWARKPRAYNVLRTRVLDSFHGLSESPLWRWPHGPYAPLPSAAALYWGH